MIPIQKLAQRLGQASYYNDKAADEQRFAQQLARRKNLPTGAVLDEDLLVAGAGGVVGQDDQDDHDPPDHDRRPPPQDVVEDGLQHGADAAAWIDGGKVEAVEDHSVLDHDHEHDVHRDRMKTNKWCRSRYIVKNEFKLLLQMGYGTTLLHNQNVIQVSKNRARAFFYCLKSLGHQSTPVYTADGRQIRDEIVNVVSDLSVYQEKFQKMQQKIAAKLMLGKGRTRNVGGGARAARVNSKGTRSTKMQKVGGAINAKPSYKKQPMNMNGDPTPAETKTARSNTPGAPAGAGGQSPKAASSCNPAPAVDALFRRLALDLQARPEAAAAAPVPAFHLAGARRGAGGKVEELVASDWYFRCISKPARALRTPSEQAEACRALAQPRKPPTLVKKNENDHKVVKAQQQQVVRGPRKVAVEVEVPEPAVVEEKTPEKVGKGVDEEAAPCSRQTTGDDDGLGNTEDGATVLPMPIPPWTQGTPCFGKQNDRDEDHEHEPAAGVPPAPTLLELGGEPFSGAESALLNGIDDAFEKVARRSFQTEGKNLYTDLEERKRSKEKEHEKAVREVDPRVLNQQLYQTIVQPWLLNALVKTAEI
eukprot:g10053.t1